MNDPNDGADVTMPSRGDDPEKKQKPPLPASIPGAVAQQSRPSSRKEGGSSIVSSRSSNEQGDVAEGRVSRHRQRDREAKERARDSGSSASTPGAAASTERPPRSKAGRMKPSAVTSQATQDSSRTITEGNAAAFTSQANQALSGQGGNEFSGEGQLLEAELAPDIDDAVQKALQDALKSHEASQKIGHQLNQPHVVAQAEKIAVEDDDDDDEKKICGMSKKLCFCFSIVVIAAAAGGVGGGLAASRSDGSDTTPPDESSRRPPTTPPASPSPSTDSAGILALTELLYPENSDSLLDEQYDAIEWIVEYDPRNLNTSFLYPELIERFSLATLFFATNGTEWNDNSLWLTGSSYCSWAWVWCDQQNSVVGLDLGFEGMGGNELPPELGNLSNLEYVFFRDSDIGGRIPTEIGLLTALTHLDLSQNSISGTLPTEIGKLTMLTFLTLEDNDIFGNIPSEVGLLTMMEDMVFTNNAFEGHIPFGVGLLTRLSFLSFWQNDFVGSIPTELGSLSLLTSLLMAENRLGSTIPAELGNMASLEELFLERNFLTGNVPSSLNQLTDLETVYLHFNDLTAGLVDLFCDANLTEFLADCHLDCACCTDCAD
eukprot:scaffold1400_cov137-Cylindrotheca_fusiformis.AAC.2